MKPVNQQAIADALNLSRATVSRCFTNHPGINPETRANVFEMASRIGYNHISMRSSNSSTKRTRPIFGVLICSKEEEYHRMDYESPGKLLLKGVSEYCQLAKVGISVHFVDPDVHSIQHPEYRNLLTTVGRTWSGLLLLYPFPKPVIDELLIRMPCVSLVEQRSSGDLDCVDVNHYQGIALLINKLHTLGHDRIGFYTKAYQTEASWSLRRFGAYTEKMTQLDIPILERDLINAQPRNIVSLNDSFDLAEERIRDGVTAYVCAADHQAYDLIRELEKRGIRTPDDVSITGFDGIPAPNGKPQLSTVQIPYRNIGYAAAKRLSDLLKKRFGPSQHILMSCQLLDGQTLNKPRPGPLE
ncbi:LacI family DNA-binding transcriptional regulator [Cerasicoccus arenae]|uniref:Catabolite control protein A n=1 Tax=Cerasicoccus arenae TaxID=424488 RepID=A0A8J3GDQ2_9BACT|nr:LacI family DNA-binding transcriptional regulator [Cerasicoccus arenae]MBK1859618.1 LacI family DNA-binding transcriptional regulator [Cerasicoccus arenae]GHC03541.1 catabolite control protein A [Cerasicoccus arenae]